MAIRCVHCLQHFDRVTDDHLFPRSWYPASTPPDLEKWKFPACLECNREYGKLEERLRLKLAACLDQKDPASAGIWQSVLDSFNPERGRSPLDQHKRKMARQRFLRSLMPVKPGMLRHALPEIYPDRPIGTLALQVPGRDVYRLGEKLVRGTIHLTERRYIEADQEITISLLKREDGAEILRLVEQFGELYERGPGIRIRKAVAQDGKMNALFVFDIWGQFRLYGSVMDRNLA
jgi:hypothetical protein